MAKKSNKPAEYDVAILGGGSAGYAAAHAAAGGGLQTVVIEGGAEVGGLCILRGCMPSKTLLYAAETLHQARRGATWGLRIPRAGFDFSSVMARKRAMIQEFADYRRQQLESGRFQFLRGQARLMDPHHIEISDGNGGSQTLLAKYIIVSTGSVMAPPPCPGLEEAGYLSSDEALALKRLPKSLIILGGGSVALELAQFFGRLDVKVTIIQRGAHLLRELDADGADVIAAVFRREGMEVFTSTQLRRGFRQGKKKGVEFEHEGRIRRVTAEEILLATGRIPNTAGLGLEEVGVRLERGRILTNNKMQTRVPHIYAAGDCASRHPIVHLAVEQGEVAAHNILHPKSPRRMNDRLLTRVVFTDPQIGVVGLTEAEAQAAGIKYLTASYPFADHGKSLIMEAKDGFVKLLAEPKSGKIIGGACVGPWGGELIHEIIAAMRKNMTVGELAAMPHYHPTLAEIWTYPAAELAEKINRK